MFEAAGVTVSRLMRVRYGPVQLPPRLKRGMTMELDPAEVALLLKQISPARVALKPIATEEESMEAEQAEE